VLTATGVGVTPFVTKVGSTYHLFDGFQTIQRFTSSDGITWAQADANVFTKTNIIYFAPVIQVAGTWYAYYSVSTGVNLSTVGYATASAITGPWTDHGTIITNGFYGIQQIFNIDGKYHAWGQSVNSSKQSSKPSIDPGEGMRMESTDLINWTNPINSIHHSHMAGDYNGVNASEVPGFMIEINGIATMMYQVNQDDAIVTAKSIFQFAVATAPSSIANILTAKEDAVQQVATDPFTRGAGGLGANWATPSGVTGLQIASSGIVQAGTTGVNCVSYYSGAAFSGSQYSEFTLLALTSNLYAASPVVYQQASGLNCYYASFTGATGTLATVTVRKLVAGASTVLTPAVAFTPNVNDVFRLMVYPGNDGFNVITLFQNGFLVAQGQDYSNTYTSGSPGALIFATTTLANAQISSWAGGNANVIPAYNRGAGTTGDMLIDNRICTRLWG